MKFQEAEQIMAAGGAVARRCWAGTQKPLYLFVDRERVWARKSTGRTIYCILPNLQASKSDDWYEVKDGLHVPLVAPKPLGRKTQRKMINKPNLATRQEAMRKRWA